jgi:hypothetical protein
LREMQMQPGVCRREDARKHARGDALLATPEGMLVIDVKIVHEFAATHPAGHGGYR